MGCVCGVCVCMGVRMCVCVWGVYMGVCNCVVRIMCAVCMWCVVCGVCGECVCGGWVLCLWCGCGMGEGGKQRGLQMQTNVSITFFCNELILPCPPSQNRRQTTICSLSSLMKNATVLFPGDPYITCVVC